MPSNEVITDELMRVFGGAELANQHEQMTTMRSPLAMRLENGSCMSINSPSKFKLSYDKKEDKAMGEILEKYS